MTVVQVVPSQCSRVKPGGWTPLPRFTATLSSTHTWFGAVATMASGTQGWPLTGASLGRARERHVVPFQCMAM